MRLMEIEIQTIKQVIHEYISDAKIILFGSRVDENKKGGDIDLLVQTNMQVTLKEKIKILTSLELNGILRQVDLIVQTPTTKKTSIIETALKEGIEL